LLFIKKLFKSLNLSFLRHKISEKKDTKSSKVYALERLKEIHNYDYIIFVANYYRAKNHTVWEYSKEKNLVNHELNLVMKIKKDILLIQCRSNMNRVTLDAILKFETVGREFVSQYALFKNYNILYLYLCSEEKFSDEAKEYMANSTHISYEILREFEE